MKENPIIVWGSDLASISASVESRKASCWRSCGFILFWCLDRICTCPFLSTQEIRESHFRGENSWLFCQKGEGLENEGLDRGKGEKKATKPQRDNWGINSSPGLCSGPIQSPLWLAPLPLSELIYFSFSFITQEKCIDYSWYLALDVTRRRYRFSAPPPRPFHKLNYRPAQL